MNPDLQDKINRGCRSKRAYAMRATAQLVIDKQVRYGKRRLEELLVYKCRHCAFFHIGHALPAKKESA